MTLELYKSIFSFVVNAHKVVYSTNQKRRFTLLSPLHRYHTLHYISYALSFHQTSPPDLYHTCYTLSGVSVAQHSGIGDDPLIIGDQLNNELLPTVG